MDSHSALVTWTSSEQPQQQLVTSYYVEYKVTNDEQVSLKVVLNHNSTSLTGLQTHAEYQVRIRAVNGAGGGIWSDYQTFSTGKTCKIGLFGLLSLYLCSYYTYISRVWSEPCFAFLPDVVEPKYLSRDQTSLLSRRTAPNTVRFGTYRTQIRPSYRHDIIAISGQ